MKKVLSLLLVLGLLIIPVRKCSAKTVAELENDLKGIEADIKDKRSVLAATTDADQIAALEVALVDLISQRNTIKKELEAASHNGPGTGTAVVAGAVILGVAVLWGAKMIGDGMPKQQKQCLLL
jgi:hypothetical protein